jgi:hypothetical protein
MSYRIAVVGSGAIGSYGCSWFIPFSARWIKCGGQKVKLHETG